MRSPIGNGKILYLTLGVRLFSESVREISPPAGESRGSPGFPGVLHGFDADTCKVGFVFSHQKAMLIDEQTFYSGKSWRAKAGYLEGVLSHLVLIWPKHVTHFDIVYTEMGN